MLEIQRGLPLTPVSAPGPRPEREEHFRDYQTVSSSRDYTRPIALAGGLAASVIAGKLCK